MKFIISNGLKKFIAVALSAWVFVPTFIGADNSYLTQIVGGESCFVPIYHTDFPLPPEGGQFVRIGSQMYYFKNYLPGCGSVAGSRASVYNRDTRSYGQIRTAQARNFTNSYSYERPQVIPSTYQSPRCW